MGRASNRILGIPRFACYNGFFGLANAIPGPREISPESAAVLESMGLSRSDATRRLLVPVARDKALPWALEAPSSETREVIAQREGGGAARFESIEALTADLNADD